MTLSVNAYFSDKMEVQKSSIRKKKKWWGGRWGEVNVIQRHFAEDKDRIVILLTIFAAFPFATTFVYTPEFIGSPFNIDQESVSQS